MDIDGYLQLPYRIASMSISESRIMRFDVVISQIIVPLASYYYFRSVDVHYHSRLYVSLGSLADMSIELGDPENMGFDVGIIQIAHPVA